MLEAARGWLTPPVLFVLVNLVIATIAVASRLMTPAAPGGADEAGGGGGGGRRAAALLRAPSLAVDRLRASFSFSRLAADHAALFDYPAAPAEEEPAHQPQETTAAGNGAEEVELEHRREEEARIERSRSEAAAELAPSSARRPRARKTRRAAAAEEPAVAPRRAAAVRREEPAAAAAEVDARADDFIQRFREQLRMQRLDSILRYRDTLRRTGTA